MKKLILILLFLPIIGFGQDDCGKKPLYNGNKFGSYKTSKEFKKYKSDLLKWQNCRKGKGQDFNGYKFLYIPILKYKDGTNDKWGISNHASNFFKNKGFTVLNDFDQDFINSLNNPCEVLYFSITHTEVYPPNYGSNTITYKYYNCNKELGTFWGTATSMSVSADFQAARKKAFRYFDSNFAEEYIYDSIKTPVYNSDIPVYSANEFEFNEKDIRNYLSKTKLDDIEGIWNYLSSNDVNYKLLILKDDFQYKAYILEGAGFWKPTELKAIFEQAASNLVFALTWTMGDKKTKKKTIATLEGGILKFSFPTKEEQDNEAILYKLFPTFNNSNSKTRNNNNGEWSGNGSGIIISKSGHIITNYHVIEDTDDIEVEFILDDEVQKFNAEIVQVDKTNDLAIIKIVDVNFDGVANLPYNFKTRSSDVGTKVYAFGYPMALSIMGKEIKVTDGIISSKTGYDGNITTYQISAPIQGGNSGGPLFDDKGNFIGINSSGINKKLADNVGYSIKTSYVLNLIDILPKSIDLPSNKKLANLPLTEQIKEISKYVVLVKVK